MTPDDFHALEPLLRHVEFRGRSVLQEANRPVECVHFIEDGLAAVERRIAEVADFLRFNPAYMEKLYAEQPESGKAEWNRQSLRPLDGFVYAVTPFNFTAIAGNLPATPAMLGNTVVWKPSDTQMLSAWYTMKLFEAAGLPAGVINLVAADGPLTSQVLVTHPELAGVHFTGSTATFQ